MKIITKLYFGFMVVTVLAFILGLAGFRSSQRIERIAASIAEQHTPLIDAVMEMKVQLYRAHALINEVPMESDPEVLEQIRLDFERSDALFHAWADAVLRGGTVQGVKVPSTHDPTVVEALETMLSAHVAFDQGAAGLLDLLYRIRNEKQLVRVEQWPDIQKQYADMEISLRQAEAVLADIERGIKAEVRAAILSAESEKTRTYRIFLIIVCLAGAFSLLFGLLFSRSIARPILKCTTVAESIAGGDFTQIMEEKRKDETGKLAASLNTMQRSLKSSYTDLESFSYSVSHDLLVPLRAIDGFSLTLQEDYSRDLDAEAGRLIGIIRANTKNMAQLINDLLAYSRLGRKSPESIVIDMKALVEKIWQESINQYPGRKVSFAVQDLQLARGDPALIRQVWQNLLANAIKFTSRRKQARIEIGSVHHRQESIYFVKDNGAGFSMQYAHKLFGMFQRLHKTEEYEGTGIGLAIVKRIIELHGGRVWAEGTDGEGAAFFFSLPRIE